MNSMLEAGSDTAVSTEAGAPRRSSPDAFRALRDKLKGLKPSVTTAPPPVPAAVSVVPPEPVVLPEPVVFVAAPPEPQPVIIAAPEAVAPPPPPPEPVFAAEPVVIAAPQPVIPESAPEIEEFVETPAEMMPGLQDLVGSLQAKFGGAKPLLRKRKSIAAPDPFADAAAPEPPPSVNFAPVVIEDADEEAGATAKSLLDIMSAGSAAQPQERALAADTLLRLAPRIPEKGLIMLAERVAIMEAPPPLLAARLIRDPRADVAAPLLERCVSLSDKDLLGVIAESGAEKQRLIARRRILSPALCEALIARGDESVLLTLTRNAGAAISHEGFQKLCGRARTLPSIQAQLATRGDTPAPIAFELFWMLPPVLRRLVLHRFLTDSETLNKILKIAMTVNGPGETEIVPAAFDGQRFAAFAGQMVNGNNQLAAAVLADMAGIEESLAQRICDDPEGEPLAVILKVLSLSRSQFAEFLTQLQVSPSASLNKDRNIEELQSIFDQLSSNKARVLVTYWNWAARNTGPYAAAA